MKVKIALVCLISLLAVPLLGEERPVGVVTVDRLAHGRPFETAVVEMVQSIADQAGVALHNIQLYEELVQLNRITLIITKLHLLLRQICICLYDAHHHHCARRWVNTTFSLKLKESNTDYMDYVDYADL